MSSDGEQSRCMQLDLDVSVCMEIPFDLFNGTWCR